jgi:hypothetical protein
MGEFSVKNLSQYCCYSGIAYQDFIGDEDKIIEYFYY